MASAQNLIKLAGFTLDPERVELRRGDELIKIRHQTLQLLLYLARHRGQTVSRSELATHLWGQADIDYDQRLNAAVRDLRKTLGDNAQSPTILQTVPRQGYRLVIEARANLDDAKTSRRRWLYWGLPSAIFVGVWGLVILGAVLPASPDTNRPGYLPPAVEQQYIEARSLLDAGDPSHYDNVQSSLEELVRQAPAYADAWASLAKVRAYQPKQPSETLPASLDAVQQALALNPDHAGALRTAALLAVTWERDWAKAEQYLQRALTLAPGDPSVYHAYAPLLYLRGELVDGEAMLRRGLAIDPLSIVLNADLVWYQTVSGDYAGAIRTCELLQQIEGGAQPNCGLRALLLAGEVEQAAALARDHLRAQLEGTSGGAAHWASLSSLPDDQLLSRYWQAARNGLAQAAQTQYVDPVNLARVYSQLGDPNATLEALEQAVEDRSMFAPYIHLFPEFRALHTLPRFTALLKPLGMPDAPSAMLAKLRAAALTN